jgi:hypothetical protein
VVPVLVRAVPALPRAHAAAFGASAENYDALAMPEVRKVNAQRVGRRARK